MSSHSAPPATDDGRQAWRPGIRFKISLVVCLLVLLILSAFWLLARDQLQQTLQIQSDNLGETLAAQTADTITELVLANDQLSLNVVLNQLARQEPIRYVAVFDVDNRVLASAGNPPAARSGGLNAFYTAQISLQDSIAGTLRLSLDASRLEANLGRTHQYFWIIMGLGLVLALVASHTLANHIRLPLLDLTEALNNPEEVPVSIDHERNDEITRLQAAAAELVATLQEGAALGAPLSRQNRVSDAALRLEGAVLAVKVVNIATAMEVLHPAMLAPLLSEYAHYLRQATRLYGGTCHRFTGDSTTVLFDSRQATEDFSFNAICSAQLFQKLMQKVNQGHRRRGDQSLEFRLAIHTGEVFVTPGLAGADSGETILGRTVEMSLLMSRYCPPGQVLVSDTCHHHAGGVSRIAVGDEVDIPLPAGNGRLHASILSQDNIGSYDALLERQTKHILSNTDYEDDISLVATDKHTETQ